MMCVMGGNLRRGVGSLFFHKNRTLTILNVQPATDVVREPCLVLWPSRLR